MATNQSLRSQRYTVCGYKRTREAPNLMTDHDQEKIKEQEPSHGQSNQVCVRLYGGTSFFNFFVNCPVTSKEKRL